MEDMAWTLRSKKEQETPSQPQPTGIAVGGPPNLYTTMALNSSLSSKNASPTGN